MQPQLGRIAYIPESNLGGEATERIRHAGIVIFNAHRDGGYTTDAYNSIKDLFPICSPDSCFSPKGL